jgi:hypothetical protein
MAKDKCVLCGKETPYDKETHVDMRRGYIEGCGQTCPGGCEQDIDAVIEELLKPGDGVEEIIGIEGCTGYDLFRYIPQDRPTTPPEWKINLFWFATGLVTSAIVVFIVYKLSKMLAL